MNNNKILQLPYIIDCLVIILEFSCFLTFLPSFTFLKLVNNPFLFIFIFCFISHIIRFGDDFLFLKKLFSSLIGWCFLLLYFLEILQHRDFYTFLQFLNVITYLSYLYNIYTKKNESFSSPIQRILFPYIAFSIYNIVTICILAILIFIGLPYEFNLIPDSDPLLVGHRDWNMMCYFPYGLSIAQDYHDISLFDIPVLSGLSHEPHVIMFLITPAIPFSFAFISNKKWMFMILGAFVFVLLETLSTTAILCSLVILVIEYFWNFKGNLLYPLFVVLILLFSVNYFLNSEMGQMMMAQLEFKLLGEGRSSGQTSSAMIEYIYNIRGLFGEGNSPKLYGTDLGERHYAGFITMVLDTIIYLFMAISSFVSSISKNRIKHYIGLGCFYYVLHGIKVNYLMVSYPYFVFIFFITYLINKTNNEHNIKQYAKLKDKKNMLCRNNA